jgi:KDO2-lipid IV(A) lauroyltransferase
MSDLLFIVLYHLVGYRKKLAYANIQKCFPHLSNKEIIEIQKESYRHLCDLMVEFFKSISIDKETQLKRMHLLHPETLQKINEQNQGALFLASHYGNFEWMTTTVDILTRAKCYGVFAPIKNRYFNRMAIQTREKWGGELIPTKGSIVAASQMLSAHAILGFVNDQTPSRSKRVFFTHFFGNLTAFHDSCNHLILKKELPVYFMDVRKVKRGHYTLTIVPIETTDLLPYSEENAATLTCRYVQLLEGVVRAAPAYWLWTHRRWKFEPNENDIIQAR